jgi:hypothetical protein
MDVTISGCDLLLEDNAFAACEMINLAITDCKTEAGEYAFAYCEKLESATIGAGETSIDSYAFYDCNSLENISIGGDTDSDENIITIEDNGFAACGAANVAIAGGTVEIGDYGFAYCKDLESVTIGKGSLKVGDYTFYDCSDDLIITYDGAQYSAKGIEKVN